MATDVVKHEIKRLIIGSSIITVGYGVAVVAFASQFSSVNFDFLAKMIEFSLQSQIKDFENSVRRKIPKFEYLRAKIPEIQNEVLTPAVRPLGEKSKEIVNAITGFLHLPRISKQKDEPLVIDTTNAEFEFYKPTKEETKTMREKLEKGNLTASEEEEEEEKKENSEDSCKKM